MRARVTIAACVVLLAVLLAWLRDPPWVGGVTSGLGPVVADVDGRPVRRTRGHAVFYIPSSAATLAIPLRAHRPRRGFLPVTVRVSIDDALVDEIVIADEQWHVSKVAVGRRRATSRRYRRVDLRLSRTWGPQLAGVLLGQVTTAPGSGS
jgi:hypothetical protein